MKPACHNREFPKTVTVQDGWEEVYIHGHYMPSGNGLDISPQVIRAPRMVEIPFKFTMDDGCLQWKEPAGAVVKGVMDERECDGCKWRPLG